MINKRFSAIALSILLAFAPVTSLAYSTTVYAAETTGTEAAVNEGTSNDSSAAVSDATYGNETQQNEVFGTNDSTELVTPAAESEDGTNTGSGNEGEPTGGTKEDEPGVGSQGGEQIDPGTGSRGGEQVDPGTGSGGEEQVDPSTGSEGGEQVDPGTGSENGESGENEDPCVLNGHSWDDGVVEAEADCTNEGRIVFTCTECGDTRYETIGAKGHSFGNWAVVKQATTRVDGTSERTCTNCGVVESKVIPHTILKVKSIKLSKTTATVFRWNVVQLNATVAPANATSTAVTWKSSNTTVATVSSTGRVVAKGKGIATITCTAKDGSGVKATCKITVKQPVTKITLSKTSLSIVKGKTFALKATATPAAANNRAVTWKSSNTKVATVTSAGKVTAVGKGTATITCTAKDGSGVKATCKVTVKILVNKVSLNRSTAKLVKGKSLQLKATVAPASASNKTVAWKSSNTKVAKVSSTGKVTAVGKGTATITCAARDGSGKKAYCKITVTAPSSGRSSNSGSSSGGGGTVWVSATGSKYHNKNNCGTMNPSKARQMSLSEAKNKGYQPCKNCYH